MQTNNKKYRILILLLLCFLGTSKIVAMERFGNISVQLENLGTTMDHVSFSLYQIASLSTDGNHYYDLNDKLENYGIEIETMNSAQDTKKNAEKLSQVIRESGINEEEMITDASGFTSLSNLSLGLYLLVQNNPQQSSYGIVAPFFIQLPAKQGEEWSYDRIAYPKGELHQEEPDTPKKPPEYVKTGDASNMNMILFMMFLSGSVCILILMYQKKRNKKI